MKRALTFIGALAVAGAVLFGIYFMKVVRSGFSTQAEPSAVERTVARSMRRLSVPSKAKKMKSPVQVTPQLLVEAKQDWAERCAVCHGNDGMGDTELGSNFYPAAPNMLAEETQGLSDGELFYVIQNGVRLSAMPAWKRAGHDEARTWGLVAFIRHLPDLSTEELSEMKRMNPATPSQARRSQRTR